MNCLQHIRFLLLLVSALAIHPEAFTQDANPKSATNTPAGKIAFNHRYSTRIADYDLVKFFIYGKDQLTIPEAELLEKNLMKASDIAFFQVRDPKTLDCTAQIRKDMTADDMLKILWDFGWQIDEKSIKIVKK